MVQDRPALIGADSAPFVFNLLGALELRAKTIPSELALQSISAGGCEKYTWARLVDETRALSGVLLDAGILAGDRIAILMENHPRWGVAFLGIQSAGAIAVPLETSGSADTLADL